MKPKVLFIDDDVQQLEMFSTRLGQYFDIAKLTNPLNCIDFLKTNKVDAIVSDLHMPIINGIKFYELLQKNNITGIPFFFLSSDITPESKVTGLKMGAFDYLSHNMQPDEIYYRINNRIQETNLKFKHITINLQNFTATSGQQLLDLTQIEFKILLLLVKKQGQLVTRDEVKEYIWPNLSVLDKTINSHLTNLRMKIEKDNYKIISTKGKGMALSLRDDNSKATREL
jgi:DNA-binding response OmpR family regulator